MAITAALVNDLRKKTGAGMMDCKNALVEADGNIDTAIDLLRKKGQKVAAKREDREAGEGVILGATSADNTKSYIITLNCETDFVAKNEDFVKLAKNILDIAVKNDVADLEALKGLTYEGNLTIADKITEQTGVIGEKIELSAYGVVADAYTLTYNHPGNRLSAVASFNKAGANIEEAAKEVAMQIAAMAPVALNKDAVSEETIARELEVGKELAIQEGKPAEMAEKIAQGRLNKFFKESTLLEQDYMNDNKQSVSKFLNSVEAGLTVSDFKRFALS